MWVPVLLYHRVSNEISGASRALCISTRRFEDQIRFLNEHGFKSVSLRESADAAEGGCALAERAVSITFDDGYRDTYLNAFPILQKYGFGATVFLVSSLVGLTNEWDQGTFSSRPVPLLSEAEILEMAKRGIVFGSHGRTHRRLALLGKSDVEDEIAGSKRDLECLLQKGVEFFSYPHHATNELVRQAVKDAGYACACGGPGLKSTAYDLTRIVIDHDNWLMTQLKVFGWHQRVRANPVLRALKDVATPGRHGGEHTVGSGQWC